MCMCMYVYLFVWRVQICHNDADNIIMMMMMLMMPTPTLLCQGKRRFQVAKLFSNSSKWMAKISKKKRIEKKK